MFRSIKPNADEQVSDMRKKARLSLKKRDRQNDPMREKTRKLRALRLGSGASEVQNTNSEENT